MQKNVAKSIGLSHSEKNIGATGVTRMGSSILRTKKKREGDEAHKSTRWSVSFRSFTFNWQLGQLLF